MRKTKIVCTLGPATDREGVLEELIGAGMDVARFNFSHGDHQEQQGRLDHLKILRKNTSGHVAALLDTKGPEIRVGQFAEGKVTLQEGQTFAFVTEEIKGDTGQVSVSYKDLYKDVKPGDKILIDDGLIETQVTQIEGTDIVCQVLNGGEVSDRKGINVPGVEVNMPFISQKDHEDILFGIEQGFDFVAASFTRTAEDIRQIRKIFEEHDCHSINIIAKIENRQGVDHIDEIIREADGIMVARGDMGVEIPLEEVPIVQKKLIEKCCQMGKPVITATQMLDSMIKHPRPTRAETTDVANAIYQGTSAIMLSGETAAGLYPVEAVKTMSRIATCTEQDIDYTRNFENRGREAKQKMTTAISHAACMTAIDLHAGAIVTVTKSGSTARLISMYRPACPIVGCATEEHVCRQLSLSWGVIPTRIKEEYSTEVLLLHAVEAAVEKKVVVRGDTVVLTAGVPLGKPGNTNLIKAEAVE